MAAALGTGTGAVFALVARMVAAERVGAVTGVVGAAGGSADSSRPWSWAWSTVLSAATPSDSCCSPPPLPRQGYSRRRSCDAAPQPCDQPDRSRRISPRAARTARPGSHSPVPGRKALSFKTPPGHHQRYGGRGSSDQARVPRGAHAGRRARAACAVGAQQPALAVADLRWSGGASRGPGPAPGRDRSRPARPGDQLRGGAAPPAGRARRTSAWRRQPNGYPTPKTAHSSRSCVPSTGLSTHTMQHWRPRSRSAAATGAPSGTSQSSRRSWTFYEHAAAQGAGLIPVLTDDARTRLAAVLGEAAASQRTVPGYAAEVAIWSRRPAGGHDGIPSDSRTGGHVGPESVGLRHFPEGQLSQVPQPPTAGQDSATLMVLTTPGDGPADWLRAGEATSAALLIATQNGLATTVLSQAAEVADTRRQLADTVVRVPEHAQLVLRVGRAPDGAAALPDTPRRPRATCCWSRNTSSSSCPSRPSSWHRVRPVRPVLEFDTPTPSLPRRRCRLHRRRPATDHGWQGRHPGQALPPRSQLPHVLGLHRS